MSSSQQSIQHFKCYEENLPIDEGINIANFTDLDRNQCEEKCIENTDCDSFAWNRNENTCNLKKNFDSINVTLKNNSEDFDFCYNIDKQIIKLNEEIDSLNSNISIKEREKYDTENDIKNVDLTILTIAKSINSDEKLMSFISDNIDSNDAINLESLINDINQLKNTIINDNTTIKSLEIKSKRQDTLVKKQTLNDLGQLKNDTANLSTPTEIKNITKPYDNTDSEISEYFGNRKLNYMEKFNNYLKNHEKYLEKNKNKNKNKKYNKTMKNILKKIKNRKIQNT